MSDDIIRMAREAGLPLAWVSAKGVIQWAQLERFFHLAYAAGAAAEREACAKECDEVGANPHVVLHHAIVCAAAIRARGEKK